MKDIYRLNRIKERAEKASPGPIAIGPDGFFHGQMSLSALTDKKIPLILCRGIQKREDADLYAHAREDILYLLKLLEE